MRIKRREEATGSKGLLLRSGVQLHQQSSLSLLAEFI